MFWRRLFNRIALLLAEEAVAAVADRIVREETIGNIPPSYLHQGVEEGNARLDDDPFRVSEADGNEQADTTDDPYLAVEQA